MSGSVVLWTIWDSRNKYCSFPAFKLDFSRGKETGLHTPHFCSSKEEQVSTRASGKYPVRSFPVQVIFLGLFSYPWQKQSHIAMFISPKQLFGNVGKSTNIRSTFYGQVDFHPHHPPTDIYFPDYETWAFGCLIFKSSYFFILSSSLFYCCYSSPHILLTLPT